MILPNKTEVNPTFTIATFGNGRSMSYSISLSCFLYFIMAYGFMCERSQVLTVVTTKTTAFWGATSCSLVQIYQCSKEPLASTSNADVSTTLLYAAYRPHSAIRREAMAFCLYAHLPE
jgi:hypothetical protein